MGAFTGLCSPGISKRQSRHIVVNSLVHINCSCTSMAIVIQMRGICVCGYFMMHDMGVTLVVLGSVTGSFGW